MKLHTNRGVFELEDEHILVNDDVVLPGETHPRSMRLWVIGHEFGPIVALWAASEQDAFDNMLDKGYEHFVVRDTEVDMVGNRYAYLGNAGEPCDLTYAWIELVTLEKERDFALCIALVRAQAAGQCNLWS